MDERKAPVYFYDTLGSTNTVLKDLAFCGAECGTVVASKMQTAGRGRLGRSFESPTGGLYYSFLLRPESFEGITSLTPTAAVAVCRALKRLCGIDAGIKWPNDLQVNGKKLCGILTESAVDKTGSRYAVIGIGINVNTKICEFSAELRDTVCSVCTVTGAESDIHELTSVLTQELDGILEEWKRDGLCALSEYRELCSTPGHFADIIRDKERKTVFVLGINDDFSLKVRHADGTEQDLSFGEITVRY